MDAAYFMGLSEKSLVMGLMIMSHNNAYSLLR